MYIDRSLRGDPEKDKLMDELKFKYCMRFKRKETSKFLLVLHSREESLLFMWNIFMPTIPSYIGSVIISNIYQPWFNKYPHQ